MDSNETRSFNNTEDNGSSGNGSMNGEINGGMHAESAGTQSEGSKGGGGARTQEFKLSGDDIVAKVRELIEEGNARRIILRNADGHNLIEFPLTAGVIGVALLPVYAALGAAVALVANLTIVVEKRD